MRGLGYTRFYKVSLISIGNGLGLLDGNGLTFVKLTQNVQGNMGLGFKMDWGGSGWLFGDDHWSRWEGFSKVCGFGHD